MSQSENSIENVIWIILDGVRNYPTPNDPEKMGKPAIFDELAQQGVEFTQAVASATSTLMAITSMMTSIPSYYLSRNLEDLSLDKSHFESLGSILETEGYMVRSIPVSYEMRRDYWKTFLQPVPHRYAPKGFRRMEHWNNEPINPILDRVLEEGDLDHKFFLYVHYNARRDSDVALRCSRLLDVLRDRGKLDRSILIICSDHGMPDPERRDFHKWLQERDLYFNRHDLIMTDDNILVPLVIQYPGIPQGKKIETAIGMIDVVPTVLDLLGIEYGANSQYGNVFRGKSLVPLVNNYKQEVYEQRMFRTDTRYLAQKDRMISIRGNKDKYVFFKDIPSDEKEQFYDLEKDPFETTNLIDDKDSGIQSRIKKYQEAYQDSEDDAVQFQVHFLTQKLQRQVDRDDREQFKKILVFGTCNVNFFETLHQVLTSVFSEARVDMFLEREFFGQEKGLTQMGYRNYIFAHGKFSAEQFRKDYKSVFESYDLIVVPLTDYRSDFKQAESKSTDGPMALIQPPKAISLKLLGQYQEVCKIASQLKSKKKWFVDYNLNVYKHPRAAVLQRYLKKMFAKTDIYRHKPSELIYDAIRIITGK